MRQFGGPGSIERYRVPERVRPSDRTTIGAVAMFGKTKVLSTGMQATGVVFDRVGPRPTEGGGHVDTYRVTVRVRFDDGTTGDVRAKLHISEVGLHAVGAVVPVRFDPADHSKIEIDVPVLAARKQTARDESRQRSLDRAEAALREQPSAGPTVPEIRDRAPGDALPTLAQIREARNRPPTA
jgi:hypothetical protein